jgi:hypothetical protein
MSLLLDQRRRTIRAPQNPLDKSTIISIYPKEIHEVKHTIQPGRFRIAAGSVKAPAILVVGSSSWWREIDEEQPLLEIPNSSVQVADAIVKDYCNGLVACNMGNAMPGIFFIPGEITLAELFIEAKYKIAIKSAEVKQNQWYQNLVKLGDIGWARSNGNPLCISDDMRMAAKELQLSNKDWMRDFAAIDKVRCIACGALRDPAFPICGACHTVVDKKKAEELGLTIVDSNE